MHHSAITTTLRPSVTPDDFKRLAASWATGVAVVTTIDVRGRPVGLTLIATTSLSIDPMQFLVCLDNQSATLSCLTESRVFGINMLAQEQSDLSRRFSGKGADKFAGVPFTLIDGVPRLDGAIGFVRCEVAELLRGGDHKIVIGNVTDIEVSSGEPLVYFRGSYRQLPLSN